MSCCGTAGRVTCAVEHVIERAARLLWRRHRRGGRTEIRPEHILPLGTATTDGGVPVLELRERPASLTETVSDIEADDPPAGGSNNQVAPVLWASPRVNAR
jgi:hypothetical protein